MKNGMSLNFNKKHISLQCFHMENIQNFLAVLFRFFSRYIYIFQKYIFFLYIYIYIFLYIWNISILYIYLHIFLKKMRNRMSHDYNKNINLQWFHMEYIQNFLAVLFRFFSVIHFPKIYFFLYIYISLHFEYIHIIHIFTYFFKKWKNRMSHDYNKNKSICDDSIWKIYRISSRFFLGFFIFIHFRKIYHFNMFSYILNICWYIFVHVISIYIYMKYIYIYIDVYIYIYFFSFLVFSFFIDFYRFLKLCYFYISLQTHIYIYIYIFVFSSILYIFQKYIIFLYIFYAFWVYVDVYIC